MDYLILFVIGFIVAFVLGILVNRSFSGYMKSMKSTVFGEWNEVELNYNSQLITTNATKILAEVYKTVEIDRHLVEHMVHDEITQPVLASIFSLQNMSEQLSESQAAEMKVGIEQLRQAVAASKRITGHLATDFLHERDITDLIASYCATHTGYHGVRIQYHPLGGAFPMDGESKLHTYRIVQFIIDHLQFSRESTHVSVHLFSRYEELEIRFNVKDGTAIESIVHPIQSVPVGKLARTASIWNVLLLEVGTRLNLLNATFRAYSQYEDKNIYIIIKRKPAHEYPIS